MSSLQLSDPVSADNSTKVAQEAKQSRLVSPQFVQMNRVSVAVKDERIGSAITHFKFANDIHDLKG